MPLDQPERAAEERWFNDRDALRRMRAAGDPAGVKRKAADIFDSLLGFENRSGTGRRTAVCSPPSGRTLRLSLVPEEEACVIHYHWSDRS